MGLSGRSGGLGLGSGPEQMQLYTGEGPEGEGPEGKVTERAGRGREPSLGSAWTPQDVTGLGEVPALASGHPAGRG